MDAPRYIRMGALAVATLALAAIGLAVQWSISQGEPYLGDGLWTRHVIWLAAGVAAAAASACIAPRWWTHAAVPLCGVGLLALVAVAAGLGPELNGARRWLSVGPLYLHVAALANLPLVLGLARAASAPPAARGIGRAVAEAVAIAGAVMIAVVLLYRQPDVVGAAFVLVVSVAVLASARRTWMPAAGLGAVALASPFVLWRFLLHAYQKERILDFLSDDPDRSGIGYMAATAADFLDAGGLAGRGFSSSSADGLHLLANARTDFALVVVGHEWGVVGIAVVLALMATLVGVAVSVAISHPDRFSSKVALGCAAVLALQAGLHAGVDLGVLPVVSTPGFPLLSYGGSATVVTLACVGILLRLAAQPAASTSPG